MKKLAFIICFLLFAVTANITAKGQVRFISLQFFNKDTCYLEKFTTEDSSVLIEKKFPPMFFYISYTTGRQLVGFPMISKKTANFPIMLKNFYFVENVLVAEIGFTDFEYNPINQPSLFVSVKLSSRDKKSFGKAQKKMLKLTMGG